MNLSDKEKTGIQCLGVGKTTNTLPKRLLEPGESLSQRVARGGFWVFVLRITQQVFGFVRLIILARILAPSDFGLLGIALLAVGTLETFSKTGFQQALVQRKGDVAHYLDTAWTVSVIRGVILFAILFFSAPYVALFFDSPQATPIIQVIGVSMLLTGLTNVGVVYFQKELEFRKQFIYQLSGTLADFVMAVSAAIILQNVWALVYGLLAGNIVRFIMSYLVHPYRPRLSFDLEQFKELFGFGKWVLGSSILVFLITQGDDIFVGKLLGVTALGFYQLAYRISNMPATEIAHVISQVTFPAYSKLQDDIPRLREAYLKVLQLTAFLSFPIAGLIFVLAPDFTKIFLGEKWMPMVPAMQVLVLAGLVRSIGTTVGNVFFAIGKPKLEVKWEIIRLATLAAFIYPFTRWWGILGTSIAVFLSIFVLTIGFGFAVVKITGCGGRNFLKMIASPLISAVFLVLSISVFKIDNNMIDVDIWGFSLLVVVGVLAYFCMVYLLDNFLSLWGVSSYKIKFSKLYNVLKKIRQYET
ncbi:MAG: lipopolysaccharide biosynthesis protein [Candidatus Brocadiales bacterium]